jgi:GTP-binding protein EngB required for normal cell division
MQEIGFAERRDRLQELLAHAAGVVHDIDDPEAATRLATLHSKLANERFHVAVLGAFKRGKSTFLNALLGANILPTGVLPLTSVVTEIIWGPTPSAAVAFADGRIIEVPLDALADFVTEGRNPRNRLGVDRVRVSMPSPFIRGGLVLFDTPGVGSVFDHNTDTTLGFLPEIDAAVFLTGVDPPISEAERAFLERVRAHAQRTFFVLNKVDLVPGAELSGVIEFTCEVIEEALGREPQLFPVSALRASDGADGAGMIAFEQAFTSFLFEEKGHAMLASTALKSRASLAELRAGLQAEANAFELSREELQHRSARLAAVRCKCERAREDLRALIDTEVLRLVGSLEADLAQMRSDETRRLLKEAERISVSERKAGARSADLDDRIEDLLVADLDAWRPEEEARISAAFRDATARFVQQADAEGTRATQACADILELDLRPVPLVGGLDGESHFSYSFFEVPTLVESLLPDRSTYLPHRAARWAALRKARRAIPALVDKHSGRIRYDLVQRVEASARSLIAALDEHLASSTRSLEAALERYAAGDARDAPSEERLRMTLMRNVDRLRAIEDEIGRISRPEENVWATS